MKKNSKQCFECDAPATELHHVVPKSLGGVKTVPLCAKCHAVIHSIGRNMEIALLHQKAIAKKRASGLRYSGQIPYGKALAEDGCTLLDNPYELENIKKMQQLRAEGNSYGQIEKILKADGIKTRKDTEFKKAFIYRVLQRVGV